MKTDLETLIDNAKKNDRFSQKLLYERYVGKMLAISKAYVGDVSEAEDIVITAFYKAFIKIEQCKKANSFPSWLRKIVINDSINLIRKKQSILYVESENAENISEDIEENLEHYSSEINIKEILEEMPTGYRLVFNLSVFEERKHKEIAEILNISEGTSKSQLSKAKKWVKQYIIKKQENEKSNR